MYILYDDDGSLFPLDIIKSLVTMDGEDVKIFED